MTYELQEQYNSKNFTPKALVQSAFGYPRTLVGITIHHWGSKGQNFDTVRDYLCTNSTPTSAHYVAMAGKVACIVSPEDAAWHAGNAKGNAQTIGIECRPEATDEDYATVAELIANIRAEYGDLPLYRHSDWTSTACPGDYNLATLDSLARGVTTADPTPIEEIDMAAKDEILARIEQVVAWEADRFKEVNAKIDQRVNDLAGWTRDDANSVKGTVEAAKNSEGTVDVEKLASELRTSLSSDLAKELGRKLAS